MNIATAAPLIGLLIAAISVVVCFSSRTSEVQKWLSGATVGVFLYFVGNYFYAISDSVNDFYQSHKLIYLATMILGLCFVYALAELCEVKMSKPFRRMTAGAIFLCMAVTLTLDMHQYWYKSVTMTPQDHLPGYFSFVAVNGWLFYAINVIILTALVIYIVFLLKKVFSNKGKKNSAIKILLIITATPPITLLLSETGILSTEISNHALIIGIDIAIMILQIRHDIMTTVPVAKEKAIESTTDGILILNVHEEFLFANPMIHSIFPDTDWENSAAADAFVKTKMLDCKRYTDKNGNEYEIEKEKIIDGDKMRGYILWVVNVTDQVFRIREEEKSKKAKETLLQAMTALASSIDAKDRYTNGHSMRVARYSQMLARRAGKTEDEIDNIYNIAMLHDVGKIGIPDGIINKPSKLNEEEYDVIKSHSVKGFEILSKITSFPELAFGAKWHHERFDGKGYPDGISGKNIPETVRIITIADSYDAMSSNRSYRNALPQDFIRKEIEQGAGKQFDPELAELWLQIMNEDTDYVLHE